MKKLFTLFLLLCTFFAASAQSIQELTRRAQNGDAVAQYNLGLTYYEGKGVTKNYVEAAKWFRKAADQGFAEAQYAIGMMYVHGEGVSKNAVEGVKWYRKAAEQGFADAQYNLGYMYVHGEGVSKNLIEAAKWYRKAAEQGQAEAQYCLGSMYYEGLGVTKNLVEAVKWWRKAAEQGDVDAQYNLGLMYYAGEGVQQNKTEGIKWLRKAADQGDINAKTYLELISKDNNNKPSTSQTKNTTSKPATGAQTSVASKTDGTKGHTWKDFEGMGLDLMYYVFKGNRGEVAGETWTLLNFNLSDHKTDVYVCGQLRDAFSHGKATLSGNRLTITYDNNDTNVITINRYDAANSTLYTSDSHGCERAFKVRKAKRWKDFSNKHLYLKYWRKGKANGTVKGEMLTYSPEQAGSSWVNYTWSGMEEGTQVGTGHMSDYLIRLKTKNTPKPKETYLYLAGFNAAQNILYAYDPNTQIIRAFTVK